MSVDEWFLTADERGNPATTLPAWSEGNAVTALIDGVAYFDRLVDEVEVLGPGDHLFLTDWRGDPDQRLREAGPTVAELLSAAARRGVVVRGLVWRSHLDRLHKGAAANRRLSDDVGDDGGQLLLDQRVHTFGSHHQKLVVLRHAGARERDVAYAGGIDLSYSRRDDQRHAGDPQPVGIAAAYGDRPAWHDVQLELRGPVVGALDLTFRERWDDPAPLRQGNPIAGLRDRLDGRPRSGGPLPAPLPAPEPAGPAAVQVFRTYPAKRYPYPFAPKGERSVARGYAKAFRRARRLIYIEDQYLWSVEVARLLADTLRDRPELHLVAVVPRFPELDGRVAGPPNVIGHHRALETCRRVDPDRVHVFNLESPAGKPVYVHAKVCVVDDVWACVGSDNFNRRSWTHDSELSCAVLDGTRDTREPVDPAGLGDGARVFARDLRLRLWREHLDRPADGSADADLLDPADAVSTIDAAAGALDDWYASGQVGPRPPGRLRRHAPPELSRFTQVWAALPYRMFYDPDGRPRRLRRRGGW